VNDWVCISNKYADHELLVDHKSSKKTPLIEIKIISAKNGC
jgi:hypothetical protein